MTGLARRIGRLEAAPMAAGLRYTVSSRLLPEGEWQAEKDGGQALADDDGDLDLLMSESDWIETYCEEAWRSFASP